MITWDSLVDICVGQVSNVLPTVFERALKDLAEPDFAKETKCIDAEKTYTTVAGTADYEMPLGLVGVKRVTYRDIPLRETALANLGQRERYHSDGTTLRQGTPQKYFLENDRLHLVPAPNAAETLRVSYFTLPTYAKKRFRALTGTTTTVVYLDLAIGEDLKTDLAAFFNVTRDATRHCNDYDLDGNRHKYTIGGKIQVTVTDETDADLAAFFAAAAGELYVAKGSAIAVGDTFTVGGTGDTTDNALAAAKGGAVAAGDLFEVTGISGSEAVDYVGTAAITAQVAGDEIELDIHEYVPMIPEIYVNHLIPYAKAMGYAAKENTALYEYWMAEYERKRDEVVGERAARGWPQKVISNARVIR